MSFKNLQQRYTERSKELYRGATYKFDGGKVSSGANDDPLIVRKPGDGYFGGESRLLGRFLPASSAAQDVKRLTLFTLSTRGIAFLAKQALLQTGNTFAKTRILNPTFVVANAIPFLHVQRNLDVSNPVAAIGGALGITAVQDLIMGRIPLSNTQLRRAGQLQIETYTNLLPGGGTARKLLEKIPVVSQLKGLRAAVSNQEVGRPEIADGQGQYFVARLTQSPAPTQLSSATQPKSLLQKAGDFLKRKTLGETTPNGTFKYGGKVTIGNFTGQRYGYIQPNATSPTTINVGGFIRQLPQLPQNTKNLVTYLGDDTNRLDYTADVIGLITDASKNSTYRTEKLSSTGQEVRKDIIDGGMPTPIQELAFRDYQENVQEYFRKELDEDTIPFLKYFTGGQGSITKLGDGKSTDGSPTTFSANRALASSQLGKVSYIKDPANLPAAGQPAAEGEGGSFGTENRLELYRKIRGEQDFDDLINVSFRMGNDLAVRFRAFVSNINETATPQYKEYQYIGRVERYISYVSVKRSVSFKLMVVAYSEEELDIVWKRINYLTSLTYPYNVYKGILQPNIIKLTLGNIYRDQPGYVTSIRSDFGGTISSWDINQEVPHGATVDINFDIIEKKATTSAGNPLYGVTADPLVPVREDADERAEVPGEILLQQPGVV